MEMLGRASKLLVAPAGGLAACSICKASFESYKMSCPSELAIGGGSGTPLPEVTENLAFAFHVGSAKAFSDCVENFGNYPQIAGVPEPTAVQAGPKL